jgi:hypothetical protein
LGVLATEQETPDEEVEVDEFATNEDEADEASDLAIAAGCGS